MRFNAEVYDKVFPHSEKKVKDETESAVDNFESVEDENENEDDENVEEKENE